MKNCLIICLLVVLAPVVVHAQTDEAPYKRFPTVPPFQLLQSDSSTVVNKDDLKKNKPVLVVLFSPTCEHCQHEITEMVKHKEWFNNVQVVMGAMAPLPEIEEFRKEYKLDQLADVRLGKDYKYILAPFFRLHNFPFLAFYDKKQELISVFEGSMPMEKLKVELEKAAR